MSRFLDFFRSKKNDRTHTASEKSTGQDDASTLVTPKPSASRMGSNLDVQANAASTQSHPSTPDLYSPHLTSSVQSTAPTPDLYSPTLATAVQSPVMTPRIIRAAEDNIHANPLFQRRSSDSTEDVIGVERQPSIPVTLSPDEMRMAQGIVLYNKQKYADALMCFQSAQRYNRFDTDITEYIFKCQRALKFPAEDSFYPQNEMGMAHDRRVSFIGEGKSSIFFPNPLETTSLVNVHLASTLLQQANQLTKAGMHLEAIAKYEKVLRIYPTVECYKGYALSLYCMGRFQEAEFNCLHAVQSTPQDGDAHNTLGHIYRALADQARNGTGASHIKDKKKAADYAKKAIDEFRLSTPSYHNSYSYNFDKALLHIDQGDYFAARKKLVKSLKIVEETRITGDRALETTQKAAHRMEIAREAIETVLDNVKELIRENTFKSKIVHSFRGRGTPRSESDESDIEETRTPTTKTSVQEVAFGAVTRWKLGVTSKQVANLKEQVDKLASDHVSHVEVDGVLDKHHSEMQLRTQMKEITDNPELNKYLKAFKGTLENTYMAARAVLSGTVATDVGGITQDVVVGLIGLIPMVGNTLATIVDGGANIFQDGKIKQRSTKFLDAIGADIVKFTEMADYIAKEIILHSHKKALILTGVPQQEPTGFSAKLRAKWNKVSEKITTKVSGNPYPEGASWHGHEDANKIIEELIESRGFSDIVAIMKFCISIIIPKYHGEFTLWYSTHAIYEDHTDTGSAVLEVSPSTEDLSSFAHPVEAPVVPLGVITHEELV